MVVAVVLTRWYGTGPECNFWNEKDEVGIRGKSSLWKRK